MSSLFAKIAQTAQENSSRSQARVKNPFNSGRNAPNSWQSATYDAGHRDFVENIVQWTEREASTKLSEYQLRGSHDLSSRNRALQDPTGFFLTEKYEQEDSESPRSRFSQRRADNGPISERSDNLRSSFNDRSKLDTHDSALRNVHF